MTEKKIMNRWLTVVGAILIQLSLGAIYAWSVFTPTLIKEAHWSKVDTQIVFGLGLAFFAIVMVIAGRLMPKVGPRVLAIVGGIVLGSGYILAGLIDPTNFWVLALFIGVMGGSGIGLAYVVPIEVGMKWFPDKKGLITGLAVAGFGFGAMLWVKLAGAWGQLIATHGLGNTFIIYGIIFMFSIVLGGTWMVCPPECWAPEGWEPPEQKEGESNDIITDLSSSKMLRTPQFYIIFLTFMFSAGAGLMSIGLMKIFPKEALIANKIGLVEASAIAGTAMAIFFSLANGIGRVAWGAISDKLGRKNSLVINIATQGIFVILFQWTAGTPVLLFLSATVIGFNFGGNFALFPTITADIFGVKNIAQNYGWIFLAYGVGGILFPILGGKLGDMGNFPLAFSICGVLCLIFAVVIAFVKPPKNA